MKRISKLIPGIVLLTIGMVIGYVVGISQGRFLSALEENKVARIHLSLESTNITPQLREYLKARIYGNILSYYGSDPGYLIKNEWDFGPVDRQALGPIRAMKDPHQAAWDWNTAIAGK